MFLQLFFVQVWVYVMVRCCFYLNPLIKLGGNLSEKVGWSPCMSTNIEFMSFASSWDRIVVDGLWILWLAKFLSVFAFTELGLVF